MKNKKKKLLEGRQKQKNKVLFETVTRQKKSSGVEMYTNIIIHKKKY